MSPPICTIAAAEETIGLAAGEEVTFGRRIAEPDVVGHLELSVNPRLHTRAGIVAADDRGWVLTNTGRWLHLRLTPFERPDHTDLAPGRSLRVPWSRVRVEVVTGDEAIGFEVTCPQLDGDGSLEAPPASGDTIGGLGLDRSTGYFRAAVALCAPRLRGGSSPDIATVAEVARALGGLPGEPDRVSQKAVERRLAHLRKRVGIGGDDADGSAAGLEVRNAGRQLVDLLIRTGTVTEADLDLLTPVRSVGDERA